MSRTQAWASALALTLFAVLTIDTATVSTRLRVTDSTATTVTRRPSPSPTPSPRVSPTPNPCPATYNPPDPLRPQMDLSFTVSPDYMTVTGHEQLTFFPDVRISDVVLRLWPNSPASARGGGHIVITGAAVQGVQTTPVIEQAGTLARLKLAKPVKGFPVSVVTDFTFRLPHNVDERYGYQPGLAWWGSGFPLLAFEPGHGWDVEPPTSAFAEASTSPVMSVLLRVTVPQAGDMVVGPGTKVSTVGRTTQFRADAIRDVAVAVGRFSVASGKTAAGVPVDAYVAAGINDSAAAYVNDQVSALDDHTHRLGPYPYPRLVSITLPNIGGGIEYPGVIFYGIGEHGATPSHEVAHQWFYSLVGDDQGRDPWLDESFATFIEALHRGTDYSAAKIPLAGVNRVGAPMSFWESHTADYFNSVYLQGSNALMRARNLVGANRFDDTLRCFVRVNANRIATPAALANSFRLLPAVIAELRRVGALAATP